MSVCVPFINRLMTNTTWNSTPEIINVEHIITNIDCHTKKNRNRVPIKRNSCIYPLNKRKTLRPSTLFVRESFLYFFLSIYTEMA